MVNPFVSDGGRARANPARYIPMLERLALLTSFHA